MDFLQFGEPEYQGATESWTKRSADGCWDLDYDGDSKKLYLYDRVTMIGYNVASEKSALADWLTQAKKEIAERQRMVAALEAALRGEEGRE